MPLTDVSITARTLLTPDDLLNVVAIGDVQQHPHEPLIVYTVGGLVTESQRRQAASRLWLVGRDGGDERPITNAEMRASHPRWSPDGRTLAFLGSREPDGPDQVWLLEAGWGDARQLTHAPDGVSAPEWMPDGSGLLLLVQDAAPAEQATEHRAGRDWVVAEEGHRFTRIHHCALDGTLTRRSHADVNVFEFDAHVRAGDDGEVAIVALIADEPYAWSWYGARLALLNADGGFTTLHTSRAAVHPTALVAGRPPDCRHHQHL